MQTNYRKIYEMFYGPIPKDQNGRSYEIHHIDGNRTNNNIFNLVALTIDDHYEIHKLQEDWGACLYIMTRIQETPEQKSQRLSILSKQTQQKNIENGSHIFLNAEFKKNVKKFQKELVANGKHHFLNGEIQKKANKDRLEKGTHNFQNSEWQSRNVQKTVKEGRHNFLKENGLKNHSSQLKKCCESCNREISLSNYKRHYNSCVKNQKNINRITGVITNEQIT